MRPPSLPTAHRVSLWDSIRDRRKTDACSDASACPHPCVCKERRNVVRPAASLKDVIMQKPVLVRQQEEVVMDALHSILLPKDDPLTPRPPRFSSHACHTGFYGRLVKVEGVCWFCETKRAYRTRKRFYQTKNTLQTCTVQNRKVSEQSSIFQRLTYTRLERKAPEIKRQNGQVVSMPALHCR